MNWKRIIGITAGLALVVVVIFRLKSNKEITDQKVYQYNKEQPVNVKADTVHLENLNSQFTYSGTFEANREAKISAEIQGKINSVFVEEGSIVKKGQSLIQLDNSLLKLQQQAVEVQIEGLEADVNRYTILVKGDAVQGVQLEKAVLALKSAKVQQATLTEQINKTTVKSPFDGVVTAKLSEEGAFAAPGVPLLQITDIYYLKFIVNVPESTLDQFRLGQSHSIIVDAYPEITKSGKVNMIASKANMGSSFSIHLKVDNSEDIKIKSGMFGKVIMKNSTEDKGIIIPSSAIAGTANQPLVYVVKNGKTSLQNITIAKRIDNKSVVSVGLKEGDVIVTNGFINLFEGANVTVK